MSIWQLQTDADKVRAVDVMAEFLHEAGREAVEKGAVVNRIAGQAFIEWPALPEHAKEGRRIMARHLLTFYAVFPRG